MSPYTVLGLTAQATRQQVKDAFRRLSQQLHPDRNKASDAAGRFHAVREAYEQVKDRNPAPPVVDAIPDDIDPATIPAGRKVLTKHGWIVSSRELPDQR